MRDLKGKSVLVIEDEADIRQFTFRVLDFEGYTVLQAENGEEGLRLARETCGLSMVLLDLRLPDCDGWAILEELKNDPELSSIPVMIFSVSATLRHQNKAFLMGASGYLAKPVDASSLRQAIAATIHWEGVSATSCPENATPMARSTTHAAITTQQCLKT